MKMTIVAAWTEDMICGSVGALIPQALKNVVSQHLFNCINQEWAYIYPSNDMLETSKLSNIQ